MASLSTDIIEEILLKLDFAEVVTQVNKNHELLQLPLIKQLFDPNWNPATHPNRRMSTWIEELSKMKVEEVPSVFENVLLLKWCYLNLTHEDKIFAITQDKMIFATVTKLFYWSGANYMGFKRYPCDRRPDYAPYDFPETASINGDDSYVTLTFNGFQTMFGNEGTSTKAIFYSANDQLFEIVFEDKVGYKEIDIQRAVSRLSELHNYPYVRQVFHCYYSFHGNISKKFVLTRDTTFSKLTLDYKDAKAKYESLDKSQLNTMNLVVIKFFDLDNYYKD